VSRLRAGDERGFTLVELLVAMLVGMVLLVAAFDLLDASTRQRLRIEQRAEAVQRGRLALEQVTQVLRSQTCLGPSRPAMLSVGPSSATFYASLTTPTASGLLPMEKRSLTFAPATPGGTRGDVVMRTYRPTGGTYPDYTWPADDQPDDVRTVARDVSLVPGTPFLRFYEYSSANAPQVVEIPTQSGSVSELDLSQIVRVDVAFDALPADAAPAQLKTRFTGEVYARTADPTDPEHSPRCF